MGADDGADGEDDLVVAGGGVAHNRVTSLLLQVYDGTSVPPPNHPCEVLAGDSHIAEELLGLTFTVSADSFFQVNSGAAELLYSKVREWAAPGPKAALLDVCCGTGTIGLTMATAAARVVGVDMSAPGIEDAKRNAAANGVTNATFLCSKAEDAMKQLVAAGAAGDGEAEFVGVVDPPRGGLHPNVTRALRTCKGLERLVYVSCNPMGSFIADCVKLCAPKEAGSRSVMRGPPFRLVKAVPVDLFPQTAHTELVALFERVGGDE
uniref:Methyltransferase domain-containing protein n=1 Tax=Bicosoecida sp. CB-2014 TaxID=1486930 RepID=A0A7S1G959_9STRA